MTHAEQRLAFFTGLYKGTEGLLELRALPSQARAFFPLDHLEWIESFIAAHAGEDLYFGVATRRDDSSGTLDNCQHLPAMFSDIDFKVMPEAEARGRLTRFRFPPSAIVRSGGGLHVYWLLREPLDLPEEADRAKGLLRRLAHAVGGDLSAAEAARILRVPGTMNYKRDYTTPRPVVLDDV